MSISTSTARTPLDQHIQQIAAFEPTPFPVISLYLDLSPTGEGRPDHGRFVRKALTDRQRGLRADTPEHASVERDADRIEAYLRDELDPDANGVAFFACAGMSFFEAVPLGAPVDGHRLFVGPVPHLYPMARLVDRYRRYAAVMLDTDCVRIFVFGLNTVTSAAGLAGGPAKRVSPERWAQARYERHLDQFDRQHAQEVVETLDRIVADEDIGHVIVIGDEAAVPLLREALPQRLADKLDVIRIDGHACEDDVLHATLEALRGKHATTLEALPLGQVEDLIVV